MRDQTPKELFVFSLLVAIGVVGRWGQPEYCFTPLAATGLFAGCYFRRTAVAALVPVTAMLITDAALAGYQSFAVMLAVYGSLALSAALGRLLQSGSGPAWVAKLAGCSAAPATLFFLISNFAVWAWSTQPYYEKTLAGVALCYGNALPFYRTMLVGDAAYAALIFGAAALAGGMTHPAQRREAV